jgi:hypothetical protein
MQSDITAKINSMDFTAGIGDKVGNRISNYAGVQVSSVQDLERVWIRIFSDNFFAGKQLLFTIILTSVFDHLASLILQCVVGYSEI